MKTKLRFLINRFPQLKSLLKSALRFLLPGRGVSSYYVEIAVEEVSREFARLRTAWKDDDLPGRQRELVDRQLKEYRKGVVVDVFDVMVKSLSELPLNVEKMRLLEVGCSSGYYSEVFKIAGLDINYTGCDY